MSLINEVVVWASQKLIVLPVSLAWAELYMTTAAVFTRFDLELHNVNYDDHVKMAAVNFFPQTKKGFAEFRVLVR